MRRRHTYRKPSSDAAIDYGHALTVGMCGAYLCNGSVAGKIKNMLGHAGGETDLLPVSTGLQANPGPSNGAIGTTGDNASWWKGTSPLAATSPFSILTIFRAMAAPSGDQGIAQIATSSESGSPLWLLQATVTGGTFFRTLLADNVFVNIVTSPVTSQWYAQLTTSQGSGKTQAEYIRNGASITQVTSRTVTYGAIDSASLWLGNGFANSNLPVQFDACYLWNRALSYSEALSILREPYQVWEQSRLVGLNSTSPPPPPPPATHPFRNAALDGLSVSGAVQVNPSLG